MALAGLHTVQRVSTLSPVESRFRMFDIFNLAAENSPRLRTRYAELMRTAGAVKRRCMGKLVDIIHQHCCLSINMKIRKMEHFLRDRVLASPYDLPDAGQLKHHWGKYHDARVQFDDSFYNGRKFSYLALNLGMSGMPQKFGAFTVFFEKHAAAFANKAYLMRNSLHERDGAFGYFTNGQLDLTSFKSDLADHPHRALLAAVKLVDKMDDRCSNVRSVVERYLCFDHPDEPDYIECITTDVVTVQAVSEIRYSGDVLKVIDRSIVDAFLSTPRAPLSDDVKRLNAIRAKCNELNIIFG